MTRIEQTTIATRFNVRDEHGEVIKSDLTFSSATRMLSKHEDAHEIVPSKFKWVVEFEVDETWVTDGFDLTDERALQMLQDDLSFAYEHELRAKVLKAPDAKLIRKAQGYKEPK